MTRYLYTFVPMLMAACAAPVEPTSQQQELAADHGQAIVTLHGDRPIFVMGVDVFGDGSPRTTLAELVGCGAESKLECYEDGMCVLSCAAEVFR